MTLAAINAFVAAHSNGAYFVVLLLAFAEAIPIIGSIVPGSMLIIAIAALIPSGSVKFWPLMTAAFVGAIVGDGLPYLLGHRHREAILSRWPLKRYPTLVEKSRNFLHRHGGKSIFLARFTPAVRGFVPVVAGITGMPARRFYAANILSAFAWAPAHILPGMLLGASLTLAGAAAGRLALLLGLLVLLIWLLIALLRLVHDRCQPLLAGALERTRQWSLSCESWLARQLRSLVDPDRSETRALALWAAAVGAAAWLFLAVLEDVVSGDPLVRADAAIYHALQSLRTPLGDQLMIGITELGDTAVTTSVTAIVLIWLLWQRSWRAAAYWAAAVGVAAALNTIVKLAIHRPRPGDLAYAGASEFSFPSGHATVNTVLWGFLAFLVTRQVRAAWRLPIFATAACFAFLIAFSRLYLGAHWFSDVVGSLAFAGAWVIVLAIAYVRHRRPRFDPRPLAAIAGCTLLVTGGANILGNHAGDLRRYAIRYNVPVLSVADWEASGWRQLPARRTDLTGELEEALTIQWAGSLAALRDPLMRSGWRMAGRWTAADALSWLATDDPRKLPVMPSLQAGQLPSLTLVRVTDPDSRSRMVVRLWPANRVLGGPAAQRLWLGSIVEERISRPLSMVSLVTARTAGCPARLIQPLLGARAVTREAGSGCEGQVLLARQPKGSGQSPRAGAE